MLDLLFGGRRLVFESPLTHGEITARLQREVAPAVWEWHEARPNLFEGTFADSGFYMVRLVRGKMKRRTRRRTETRRD
jgi:hypothetical protein